MKNNLDMDKIKDASLSLFQKNEKEKNAFLESLANILLNNTAFIVRANRKDIQAAEKNGLSAAFIQRLILGQNGIKKLILKLKNLQQLKSGVGDILEKRRLKNGILLKKISVPLGVILVIYEARPEVTIDAAALCVKSGNAAILKGGAEAMNTNKALYKCIMDALERAGLDKNLISFVWDRGFINTLLLQNEFIDLVIARGSYGLVKAVQDRSLIPVLAHSAGGARIYIDKSARLPYVFDILINAKTSKPAACNSLDTILVHKQISDSFILEMVKRLKDARVTVLGDEYISKLTNTRKAKKNDWDTEFLDLVVSVKIVDNVDGAIKFIKQHTKKHSEAVIATNSGVINKFTRSIDAAAIFINCSTRFHDGYEFGMGSEMGIATGKLHARGPVGLKELTCYKWEAYGDGQIR